MNKKHLILLYLFVILLGVIGVSANPAANPGAISFWDIVVAGYTFDNGTALDILGNYTGSAMGGVQFVDGINGSLGARFDGVDDVIQLNSTMTLSAGYTVAGWVKTTDDQAVMFANSATDTRVKATGASGSEAVWYGSTYQYYNTVARSGTQYYFLIWDVNSVTAGNLNHLYVDNVNTTKAATGGGTGSISPVNVIGSQAAGDSNLSIDEFIVFNRILTPTEKIELRTAGSSWDGAVSDTVTVNIVSPATNEHNNQVLSVRYNISQSAGLNTNITLYINGTTNTTSLNSVSGTNYNITSSTMKTDGNYSWLVQACDTNTVCSNSSLRYFYYDTVNPTISWGLPSKTTNRTIVLNNFTTNINLTDDNLYSYNLNFSRIDGTLINNFSNASLTGRTSVTLSHFFNLYSNNTGIINGNLTVCDSHTAKDISFNAYKYQNELQFEGVRVYLDDKTDTSDYSYTRLSDRYSFNFKTKTSSVVKTFVVESSQYIDILNGKTGYKGHIVTGDKWVDFENPSIDSVEIVRVNDYKVSVTVVSKSITNNWNFNSVGELNCVTESVQLFSITASKSNTATVSPTFIDLFSLNVTYNKTFIDNLSAVLVYNGTSYSPTANNNTNHYYFNSSITAPSFTTNKNVSYFWNYTIDGTSYILSGNQTVIVPQIDNCTTFTTPFINFTILNESNNAILNGTIDYLWDYNVSAFNMSYNGSMSGNYTYSFCLYPSDQVLSSDLVLEYSSTGFSNKLYYLTKATLSSTMQAIYLYLTPGTTQVQFTVTDAGDDELTGAIIKIISWDVGTGTGVTTEIIETDSNGDAYGQIILNTQFYKFVVEYNGEVVLETTPQKITSLTNKFRVNLDTDYYDNFDTATGITHSGINFVNATKTFSWTYSDTSGVIHHGCLNVKRLAPTKEVDLNTTCVTSSAGSISYTITEATGSYTYVATAYVLFDDMFLLDTYSVSLDNAFRVYGTSGIFIVFFMVLFGALLFLWSHMAGVIVSVVLLGISMLLGLIGIGWATFILVLVMGIVTVYRLNK